MHVYQPILPFRHLHISTVWLWRVLLLVALLLAVPFLASCRHHERATEVPAAAALTLTSDSFEGGAIPKEFTCDGEDKSPALTWTAPPARAKTLALIVTDPDAPGSTFTHWVLFNLPANTNGLPVGVPNRAQLSRGDRQGKNNFSKVGYGGPCPPVGQTHRYIFTLYALDSMIDVPAGAPRDHVEAALQGHVLTKSDLTASYGR